MSSRRTYSSSRVEARPAERNRIYATPPPPPPEPYHGRQFERAMVQEEYWNSRGSTQVWDPLKEMDSVAARPDTYGRAHTICHESRLEHEYSDPYKKRPQPYTARADADYKAYKRPSEGHRVISQQVHSYKQTPVGRNVSPHEYHRDSLLEGKRLAREGRNMANIAAQSRTGFEQKYPQAYEDREAIKKHAHQGLSQKRSAGNYRDDDTYIDGRLAAWEKQMERRGRHYT
ncbi:uncharacterized protein TRUGW13939_04780 [Talaromyces rugulosus]|uniref:Uncharacterized protein n=1 Tax=Talaromyces rugulosus TaxID=121627 RepID=A0A7H8QUH7_TALRU|nr:uncharacterized protein TRUGW13939_04780 [Talaromyces rugulosus]QKX57662.1 hypothetical protein TRUGW13939_04780 [Talaromyces rugulosus]